MAEQADRAALAAAMKERWSFLFPWCQVLKRCIHDVVECVDDKVVLHVNLPSRSDRHSHEERDITVFRNEFQKVQEGLMLLAAVAHIDYPAYPYLISDHCGVKLGKPGEELFAAAVQAKFELGVYEEPRVGYNEEGTLEHDLVRLCGPQIQERSDNFTEALSQIAAFEERSSRSGLEITIPVQVSFAAMVGSAHECAKAFVELKEAEQEIKARWSNYDHVGKGGHDNRAFRFVLEPMIVDISCATMTSEMVNAVESLVFADVCFTEFAVSLGIDLEDEFASVQATEQLMACLCDTSRRGRGPPNTDYHYGGLDHSSEPRGSFQFGTLELMCNESMQERAFEAICSAVVLTQSTKKLVFCMEPMINDDRGREHWWKWVAYALFSKRARTNSSIEALVFNDLTSLNIDDANDFVSILLSEHPEEDLFNTPRGRFDERDATLIGGAPVRWAVDEHGQPDMNSPVLTHNAPIPFVRTFGDDGSSARVNALVPGIGRCQVRRCDLRFDRDAGLAQGSCPLLALSLNFIFCDDATELDGLLPFLKSIGSSLKELTLKCLRQGLVYEIDENAIIRFCPSLQNLVIIRELAEVELDFSEYRARKLPIPELTLPWYNVAQLAHDLSDPANPLAIFARRVRVSLSANGGLEAMDASSFAAKITAIVRMLQTNERLERLKVQAPYSRLASQVLEFHNKPICRQAEPLSIKAKIALLSVVASQRALSGATMKIPRTGVDTASRVVLDFDKFVLANIFSFAAPPILRKVFYDSERYGVQEEQHQA